MNGLIRVQLTIPHIRHHESHRRHWQFLAGPWGGFLDAALAVQGEAQNPALVSVARAMAAICATRSWVCTCTRAELVPSLARFTMPCTIAA